MAKGLKPGDLVTVKEPLSFTRSSEAYKQGLQTVKPGDAGRVVGTAKGRSMTVEFNGVQAAIASQRLQKVSDQPQPTSRSATPKRTKEADQEKALRPAASKQAPAPKGSGDYDRRWIATLANKLLTTGTTKPDQEAVVEIRLGDLPEDLQHRIQALVRAKLTLGLEPEDLPSAPPKAKAPKPGATQTRGRKSSKAQ